MITTNYLIKSIKDYKQYDTRWGGLSYRVLPACVRLNGCGAASVADIIVANPKYKDKTVKYARKWLIDRGYVSANQGTYHSGIPAAMRAHGYTDVKDHKTMSDCFAAMAKDYRAGIILFRAGSRGGRTFTSGGHFCAIKGYKEVNGKHYLYICDPGPRANNGFICYETEMKGLVYKVWTGRIPGTKKATKTEKEPAKKTATYKGFDISYVQNGLDKKDFQNAKKAGWDFAIIRLGTVLKGKLYTDAEFESKYKNAKAAGLNIGVYFYSMAKTKSDAKSEAAYVLKQLKCRELQYPVYIDIEDKSQSGLSKSSLADICNTFCKTIAAGGYTAGVYASYNWLANKIGKIDSKYHIWLAQYPKATYKGTYDMHQYTSSGNVTGIGAKIDCNTATLKPKKMKPLTNAEKIAETATKLAYKGKPDDAKYPGGKPTDEYKAALDKNYPDRKSWGVASRKGAACDVFVGTVVRDSGIDKNYPRGLSQQGPYLKKSSDFEEIKNPTVKDLKNGDIIIYEKKSGGGHTCIYVDGKIKEASHEKWYGVTTDTAKSRMDTKNKTWLRVYREK